MRLSGARALDDGTKCAGISAWLEDFVVMIQIPKETFVRSSYERKLESLFEETHGGVG